MPTNVRTLFLVHNQLLHDSIAALLHDSGEHGFEEVAPGAHFQVVVTTTSDCPPDDCRVLAGTGSRVVVLASVPNELERVHYIRAGAAAYVAMASDHMLVRQAIVGAASGPSHPAL